MAGVVGGVEQRLVKEMEKHKSHAAKLGIKDELNTAVKDVVRKVVV